MATNRGHDYVERLGPEADGKALLAYLASRYPHSSEVEWSTRIADGLVLLEGHPTSPDAVLRRGQSITWRRPPWEEPPAPLAFAVLHEDEDVLGIAKPAGLPTLPGGGFLEHTLLHRVRAREPRASPLHRLGRWTSGVVLFAKNREAHRALSRAFAAERVSKRYRALAAGEPGASAYEVTVPIGPVPHPLLGTVHAASPRGRSARTRVEVLERREGAFLCDVAIATGRPHQIRIHLAAAGHPLVGDPLYPAGGVPSRDSRALPGDPGYLLHAAEIRFRHPATGKDTTIVCAPPDALRRGPGA